MAGLCVLSPTFVLELDALLRSVSECAAGFVGLADGCEFSLFLVLEADLLAGAGFLLDLLAADGFVLLLLDVSMSSISPQSADPSSSHTLP